MSCALESLHLAAKVGSSRQILPRLSAVALGKRRELSTSAPLLARDKRPYATPDQLRKLEQQTTSVQQPAAGVSSHLTEDFDMGPSNLISEAYMEQLYSVLKQPPLPALAALAARLPKALFDDQHTSLVELCCIHPSFWDAVDDAQPIAADRKGPHTHFWDESRESNAELAALGESMLGMFAIEHLDALYPHVPERIMREAVDQCVGVATCADIARTWGIFAGRTSAPRDMTDEEIQNKSGMTAGQGLLRWGRKTDELNEIDLETGKSVAIGSFVKAMASVAKAVVGAVFQEHTRIFVHSNWFSRKLDIETLLKFVRPTAILMETLVKYGREPQTARLLKEVGRDSHIPVFVVGMFSGKDKLGEGYGSSMRMAEGRAAEDALRRIYLQRSFASQQGLPDLHEELVLPSETLCENGKEYVPRPLGDDEVEFGRASKPALGPLLGLFATAGKQKPRKQDASQKMPTRPTSGPGSKDPSLPLESRQPRSQFNRVAGGPQGRREKGYGRPTKPLRPGELQTSPYAGPFDERSRQSWSLAQQKEFAESSA